MLQAESGEQFIQQIVQIMSASESFQLRRMLGPGPRQVESVKVAVVQKIAWQPIDFPVDLSPFRARIHTDFQSIQL